MAPFKGEDDPTPILDDLDHATAASQGSGDHERYERKGEIGRGGIGRVVEAVDRRLDRPVAIKELIRPGRGEARFAREARITARLQHPAIVPVYDSGTGPGGAPFYSMKLVAGRSLDAVIAAAASVEARLALLPSLITVAEAIAYAHSQRVIHRDLKPANVLLGEFGETVVIDWGMARELDEPREADGVAGTPAYMAPEQAAGEAADERTDVYALGAILYQALAGGPPYRGASSDEVLGAVRAGPPPPLGARAVGAPAELCAIAEKAMARDRSQRYPTAAALAEDLRRFQTGALVQAHAYSSWALVARFLRRHRAAVSVAAAAALALAAVGAVSVRRIVHERRVAESERDEARRQRAEADEQRRRVEERENEQRLLQARARLETDPTSALGWLAAWQHRDGRAREAMELAADALSRGAARHLWRCDRLVDAAPVPGRAVIAIGCEDGVRVVSAVHGATSLRAGEPGVTDVEVSASGGYTVAWLQENGDLWISRPAGVDRAGRLASGVAAMVMAGDVLLSQAKDGALTRWRLDDGVARRAEPMNLAGTLAAAGGGWVVVLTDSGAVALHTDSLEQRRVPLAEQYAFSADGARLAVVDSGGVRAGPVGERLARVAPRGGEVLALAISASHVAWADAGGVWLARAGAPPQQIEPFADRLALSADGRWLAVAGRPTVTLHDLEDGRRLTLHGVQGMYPLLLAFDEAGGLLLATQTEARWYSLRSTVTRLLGGGGLAVAAAPGGADLAVALADGAILRGRQEALDRLDASSSPRRLAWRGDELISLHADGAVMRWPATGGPERVGEHAGADRLIAARDRPLVATAGEDGLIRVHGGGGGARELRGHQGHVFAVRFVPRGARLVSGGADGTARLWDTDRAVELARFDGQVGMVMAVDVSPDGTLVATGDQDGGVRLFDAAGGAGVAVINHPQEVYQLAFSADGAWLASTGWDGSVRAVRLADRREIVLGRHQGAAHELAFRPGWHLFATAGADGTVRLWDPDTGASLVLRAGDGALQRVAVLDDGAVVASGVDARTRLWPDPWSELPPAEPGAWRVWLGAQSSVVVGADGVAATPP